MKRPVLFLRLFKFFAIKSEVLDFRDADRNNLMMYKKYDNKSSTGIKILHIVYFTSGNHFYLLFVFR